MRLADYKKHYKETLRLGGPIMLGQLGVIVVGFVDNIMVGHHGATELAAASFVNNFFALVFIFGMGFSYGLTPIIGGLFVGKEYDKAVPYLLGRGFPVILQADNGTYLTQETQDIWYSLLMKHVGRIVQVPSLRIVDELPDDEEVNKLLYIGGPLIEVSQALVPEFQTVANTVGLPPDMMGEVMLAGITKATGMDIVMEHYGLDIAESVAIGDGANDIEMVEHAGLGIAMGNASSDLLAVADYITDDVEADGLRKAVEHAISRSSRSRT